MSALPEGPPEGPPEGRATCPVAHPDQTRPQVDEPVKAGRLAGLPGSTWLTWALAYGVSRWALSGAAKKGDLISRMQVDPELRRDPFPAYDEIRAHGMLTRGRVIAATSSHGACNQILRSEGFGVAAGHAELPPFMRRLLEATNDPHSRGPVDPPSMLAVDPPVHTRYRKLVSRVFTARAVSRMEPRIRQLADDLLDRIEEDGSADFDLVERYASQLPVAVIADILGVPDDMRARLLEWGDGAATMLDPGLAWGQYRDAARDVRQLHAWFDRHVAQLRRDPGDDLLSRLTQLDGADRLSDLELRATGLLLLGAGFETTVNLIGNAVMALSDHPDQRDVLREDPGLWGNAVEEVLRYDSPVQLTVRSAYTDTEVGDGVLKAGEAVLVMLGGANRDPAVFEDPHRFDVRRPNAAEHLALSAGVHFCLGASLARLEATVALQRLYERFPDLTVTGTPARRGTRVLRGYERLPVATVGNGSGPGAASS